MKAAMIRKAVVNGAEHTDSSLAEMKTGDIAALIAAIRGGNPPKPATKAKAIELFWKAAETLPEVPQIETKSAGAPQSRAEVPEATTEPRGAEKDAPETAPRKAKRYSVQIDGPEAVANVAAMLPQARQLAQAMKDAARPLTMAECAGLLASARSKNPTKVVAWYFARVFRPAGILTESRDGRGA
jgi:hypothetical protein